MNHPPPAVLEDQEDIKKSEVDRDHGAEINGPGNIQMVAKERQPGGGFLAWIPRLDHVLADCVLARRFVIQERQRIPDSFSSPKRVFPGHPADQVDDFQRD